MLKKIALLCITLFCMYNKIYAYDFLNEENESAINSKINEIYSSKQQYEDLMGTPIEEDDIIVYETSTTSFWWPIGSIETKTSNGKTYAYGTPESISITSGYGATESGIHDSGHTGIDISGTLNSTNVIAAQSGIVIAAVDGNVDRIGDLNPAYKNLANYVIIQHDNGMKTMYWHLAQNSVTVSEGERVDQGQVIGKLGSSGYSTGPHLHFQVKDASGNNQNPLDYVDPSNPRPTNSGNSELFEMLNFLEGTTTISGDSYTVIDYEGYGIRTVGSGVTLEYNSEKFEKYGINIDDYPVGSLISIDIVNKIKAEIVQEKKDNIKSYLSKNNITLLEYQVDALVIRTYQWGDYNGFANNYKKYGATDELYNKWWFKIGNDSRYRAGLTNRRNYEWKLFTEGVYTTKGG